MAAARLRKMFLASLAPETRHGEEQQRRIDPLGRRPNPLLATNGHWMAMLGWWV
jgi:hypothetical protein